MLRRAIDIEVEGQLQGNVVVSQLVVFISVIR